MITLRADPLTQEDLEKGEGKTCDVCYEDYRPEDFFSLECQHSFCVNCIADHMEANIEDAKVMKLPCMQLGCKK